jgi:hypothetical protein
VRNKVVLDGPTGAWKGAIADGLRLPTVLDLKERDLASDELLIEADIMMNTYSKTRNMVLVLERIR